MKKAIAKGIEESFFGYYSGSTPSLGGDGKYQVPLARVRFNVTVGDDEIDLESGFLMIPQTVPLAEPSPATAGEGPTGITGGGVGWGLHRPLRPRPGQVSNERHTVEMLCKSLLRSISQPTETSCF